MLDVNTVPKAFSRLACGLAAALAVACSGDDGGTSAASDTASSTTSTTATTATTGGTGESTDSTSGDASTSGSASAGETSTGDATTTSSSTTTSASSDSDSEATTSTGGDTTTSGGTTTGGADYGCDDPIFANDFDDDAVGLYADLDDWNEPSWDNGVDEDRVEIIDGAAAFSGRSLRIHYPEGGVGPSEGGAQWKAALDGSYDELYLAYRVRFADGFDFVKGGKLPGLVGGSAPTGCNNDKDGFSARSMWRTEGHGVQYMYFPEKQNNCGDDYDYTLGGDPALFEPGVWHTLEHRLVMNTPGEYDGHVQAWLDGELVLDQPDFLFRLADGDYAIDTLYFSTFFGGSGNDWAPTKDETVDFDDFVVCAAPISH